MFSIRRYVIYLCLAAIIVLTYRRLLEIWPDPYRIPKTYPGARAINADVQKNLGTSKSAEDGKVYSFPEGFKWSEVTADYPVPTFHPLPTGKPLDLPPIQAPFPPETYESSRVRKRRRDDIVATFKRGWKSYRNYAWGHDEVLPLSGGFNDKFGGWGATLVDNLDTLWIMGLRSEFEEAVNAVVKIDLTKVKVKKVNVFETTIRHLGGLLSAYDLSGDRRLLTKAVEFGNMLYKAFDTSNHLPITRWSFESAASGTPQELPESVLLAEIGSLSLEFTRLSQLTGDPKWYDAVHRITLMFADSISNTALPGMFPINIGVQILDMSKDTTFTLNGMADSFYEYLPKMHLLLGGLEPTYEKLYTTTTATAMKYTLFQPMTPDNADIIFSGVVRIKPSGPELTPEVQHLGCFAGGMFMLGGKTFDIEKHAEVGRKLTDGCTWAYKNHPMGVMSESFQLVACQAKALCLWNEDIWREEIASRLLDDDNKDNVDEYIARNRLVNGIVSYDDPKYHLRPEALESIFIQMRTTGDTRLHEDAWVMYSAIMNMTASQLGNAAVSDVTHTRNQLLGTKDRAPNKQFDSMESFWLAETLKYLFLIYSDSDVLSLDEWVFNTEAHPFRRPQSWSD